MVIPASVVRGRSPGPDTGGSWSTNANASGVVDSTGSAASTNGATVVVVVVVLSDDSGIDEVPDSSATG